MRALLVACLLTIADASDAAECVPIRGTEREAVVITTTGGKRLKGVLVCADAEKLVVLSGSTTRSLPIATIGRIVTARDPVWNGLAVGASIGALIAWLGSYEAHLREPPPGPADALVPILVVGGLGAAIDAARHTGGRIVTLPGRNAAGLSYRIRF